jgi:hypothetical protein
MGIDILVGEELHESALCSHEAQEYLRDVEIHASAEVQSGCGLLTDHVMYPHMFAHICFHE